MPRGNWPGGWVNISSNRAATALPVLLKEKGSWINSIRNGSLSFEMGRGIKKGITEVWREGWQFIRRELFS